MKKIFLSVLVIALISLIPLISNAQDAAPQIHAQGEFVGDVSISVELDGVTTTYTLADSARSFHLRPNGTLTAGATTRCDPRLGVLKEALSLKVDIKERYTQGEYDPESGRSPRTQVGPTGEESITFPAGSSVSGRCGNSSNSLVAFSIFPPRN